jgi:hypothetical protein
MAFAREIIESHDAASFIDNEIKRNPKLADFWEGVKWRLARGPEMGYRAPRTHPQTYVIHSYHWGVAGIVVTYRFSEDQVEILNLKIEMLSQREAASP